MLWRRLWLLVGCKKVEWRDETLRWHRYRYKVEIDELMKLYLAHGTRALNGREWPNFKDLLRLIAQEDLDALNPDLGSFLIVAIGIDKVRLW
jgi:hypothetical protein